MYTNLSTGNSETLSQVERLTFEDNQSGIVQFIGPQSGMLEFIGRHFFKICCDCDHNENELAMGWSMSANRPAKAARGWPGRAMASLGRPYGWTHSGNLLES